MTPRKPSSSLFRKLIGTPVENYIWAHLSSEMADHLEDCATDPSHQPAIYAAFIREIVRKTREARNPQPVSAHPSRAGSPTSGHPGAGASAGGIGGMMNGTIDPALTKGNNGGLGALNGNGYGQVAAGNGSNGINGNVGVYDPALLDDSVNWGAGEEPGQFTFIPQGGDMM